MGTLKDLLDPIQRVAIDSALQSIKSTGRALVDMATGTGKTNVALNIIDELIRANPNERVLWITHTRELLDQAFKQASVIFGAANVGLFTSEIREPDKKIVIASIQTLSRRNHLGKFDPDHFSSVFVDECHHAAADTWLRAIEHFKNAKRIGMSATPDRPDSKSVDEIFGEKIFELSFSDAQQKQVLAKDENFVILTNTVFQGATIKTGEYSKGDLDRVYASIERDNVILDSYRKYGQQVLLNKGSAPKTICFCINTKHAIRLCRLFEQNGIKSAFVCGNEALQSDKDRKEITDKFRETNEIEVIFSVDIYREGVNVPDVNCVLMARPTRSYIVYSQQIGRSCRRIPGIKESFIVLDFVDNVRREWQCYTLNNLIKRKSNPDRVVVEYLSIKDPILVEERVLSVMKGVEDFKAQFGKTNWTYETGKLEALKYDNKTDWFKKGRGSYSWALKNGFYEEFSAHMAKKKDYVKDMILDFVKENKRAPSASLTNPSEASLRTRMRQLTSPNETAYDKEFTKEIETLLPGFKFEERKSTEDLKNDIFEFIKRNGRFPKRFERRKSELTVEQAEENNLVRNMNTYKRSGSPHFDPDFTAKLKSFKVSTDAERRLEAKKVELKSFILEKKRIPNADIKEERSLASIWIRYVMGPAKKPKLFNRAFSEEMKALLKLAQESITIQECLDRAKRYSTWTEWSKADPGFARIARKRKWLPQIMLLMTEIEPRRIGIYKKLEAYALSGAPRPGGRDLDETVGFLGRKLSELCSEGNINYDPVISRKLREIRPDWFDPLGDSFRAMISRMPSNVQFAPNQVWNGVGQKYVFIDQEYGEFKTSPSWVYKSWSKGFTGHPKRKAIFNSERFSKPIRNVITGEEFSSVREAAAKYKVKSITISVAVRKGRKVRGHVFEYVNK